MVSTCLVVLISLFRPLVYCFTFDTDYPIVYEDPAKTGNSEFSSYFGYSTVLFPGNAENPEKWIKIAAPRGQDPRLPFFKNSGVVYDCSFPLKECKPVNIHQGSNGASEISRYDLLNNSWIGGTMDISQNLDEMVVCGFRGVREVYNTKTKNLTRETLGVCYISSLSGSFSKIPIEPNPKQGGANDWYQQSQFGFSVHFSKGNDELVLGAPGAYAGSGGAISCDKKEDDDDSQRSRRSLHLSREKRQSYYVDTFTARGSSAVDYAMFGYAITSGYFYDDKTLYYVAGVPRGSLYSGNVTTFQFSGSYQPPREREKISGHQLGEYFGASVAAGDINNDGFDDLVVGAPFNSGKTYNTGAVYIFLSNGSHLNSSKLILVGQNTGAQFGSTVMFLDDINDDGFKDIAIGAPYEEDSSGVVYIYNGNSRGVYGKYSQRIVGKDISREIRGFGISISRPADIDANGYKDIAIGAHLSADAVLLRSKPVIVIDYTMTFYPKELKRHSKKFQLEICFSYSHFKGEVVGIRRNIIVDTVLKRAALSAESQKNETRILRKTRENCENVTISIKNATYYMDPITIFLSYELDNSVISHNLRDNDNFCSRCPVIDEYRSKLSSASNISFILDCGGDKICQAALSIDAKIIGLEENVFVVGSMDYLDLKTTVSNAGEKSYATKLEIELPVNISFREVPPSCDHIDSLMICDVGNPLNQNSEKSITVGLNMKNVNDLYYNKELTINFRVRTSSENVNSNRTSLKLKLRLSADITIFGESEEQSFPFTNITSRTSTFTHAYKVQKLGPSPLERILVNITVPYAIRVNNLLTFVKHLETESYFYGRPVTCLDNFSRRGNTTETTQKSVGSVRRPRSAELDTIGNSTLTLFLNCSKEGVVCANVWCYIGPFRKSQTTATVKIKMVFEATEISDLLERKHAILYSTHGSVVIKSPTRFTQSGNSPDYTDVSIFFIDRIVKEMSVWIIILAVLIGLLLLALIVYGLYRFGFFKRRYKEEMYEATLEFANQGVEQTIEDSASMPLESRQLNEMEESDEK